MGFDSQSGPPRQPSGQWQQPEPPAPRGPKRKVAATIAVALVAAAIYVAVNELGKSPAAATVTYVVTGDTANVTYGPAGSDLAGSVPMRTTAAIGAAPASYYAIDAQLQGTGTVSCEILVDGKVVSESAASGGYGIARCEIIQDPLSGAWRDANAG